LKFISGEEADNCLNSEEIVPPFREKESVGSCLAADLLIVIVSVIVISILARKNGFVNHLFLGK